MDKVEIMDPIGRAPADTGDGIDLVARPRRLAGLRLGLLDNGKPNAAAGLEILGGALHRRHEVSYVALTKAVSSKPCPDELLVRFRPFDAAVVGVGD